MNIKHALPKCSFLSLASFTLYNGDISVIFPLDNDTWPLSCDTDYEDIIIADNTAQLVFSTDFSVTKYGFHIAVQSGLKLVIFPDIVFVNKLVDGVFIRC